VIQFNFVMLKSNLRDMPKMVDLAHELGGERLDFRLPFLIDRQGIEDDHPARDPDLMDAMIVATRERAAALGISFDQIPETNASRREKAYRPPPLRHDVGHAPDQTAHCEAPWGFLVIWPTGDIHPCCSPYMLSDPAFGNIDRATFAQIVTGPAYDQLRDGLVTGRLADNCAKCLATDLLGVNELHDDAYLDVGPRLPIAGVPGGRYRPLA
jgi:radical SAM protein with 4Fe4S-binding SPASM domain